MDEINSTISKPTSLPLQVDEFFDILGGQSWLQFIYNLKHNDQQHRIESVSKLKSALTGKNRFFCSGDLLDRQALEIFFIKLSALVRTTQVIKDAHQLLSSPLQNISHYSMRIGMQSAQSLAPSLWNYRIVYERSERHDSPLFNDPNNPDNSNSGSPHHDFYCLGMLIFRALLVNRTQPIDDVKLILDHLSKTITEIYKANKHSVDQDNLHSKLIQVLDSFLNEDTFKQCNLVYKPHYYTKDLIDPALWRGTLSIAFRLITRIPHFSFFSDSSHETCDVWEISQDVFSQLSEAEHQAKRNLLTESINSSTDVNTLISELTEHDNWQAEYFDSNNTLKKSTSSEHNNDMIEIDIFGLEEDLAPGVMLKANTSKNRLSSNNDSSQTMEFFDNILEE